MTGVIRVGMALSSGLLATSILTLAGFAERFGESATTAALLAVVAVTLAIGGHEWERLDPVRCRTRRRS